MASHNRLSRRGFLGASLGVATAAALSACVQPPPPPTQAPQSGTSGQSGSAPQSSTPTSGDVITIRALTSQTFIDQIFQAPTGLYNEENQGKVFVKLEAAPQGWETKIIQMVKDQDVIWDAYLYDAYFGIYQRVKAGVLMPLDDLIKSSSVPWAKDYGSTFFIPKIADAHRLDGQIWQIPAKIDVVYMLHNVNMINEVGYETIPETWDEFKTMCRKIKDRFGSEDVIPTSFNLDAWRSLGGVYCTFTANPYTADGYMDVQSKEYAMALEFMKSFYDEGLANPNLIGSPDEDGTWQKAKMATYPNSTSRLVLAWTAWGKNAYAASVLPKPNQSDPLRTKTYVAGSGVFMHAPNPQETLDYLLTVHGPEGKVAETFTKHQINLSGAPVHKTWIESDLVKGNSEHPYLYPGYSMIEHSTPAPISPLHLVLDAANKKYVPAYFKGEISLEETIKKIYDQVQADKDTLIQSTG